MLYGIDGRIALTLDLLQGRQDNSQRRTDIMGGIDEEFHLLLVHLPVRPATVAIDNKPQDSSKCQQIETIGQCGTIPRRCHFNGNGLDVRTKVPRAYPHLNGIDARLQMTQLDDIDSLWIPYPRAITHTVFIGHTSRIIKIEQREFQCQFRLHIGHFEMVGANDRPRFMSGDGETCQMHIFQFCPAAHHIRRTETNQTVVGGKVDIVVIGMESYTVYILLRDQAVAIDVANVCFFTDIILPEPHRRRAPDVPIVSLDDIAYHLVTHFLHQLRFITSLFIHIQSLIRTNQNLPATCSTKGIALHMRQHLKPPFRQETVGLRIIARNAIRGCQPDSPFPVGHHRQYPVIADMSTQRVAVGRTEISQLSRLRVIDTEAL